MDELIIRFFKGDATDVEMRRLQAWRSAAPGNEAYFQDTIRLLEATETAVVDRAVPPRPPVAAVMLAADGDALRDRVASRNRLPRGWWGGAALLAAAAVAALFWAGLHPAAAPEPEFSLGTGEFVTSAGETVTVTLADGTIVRLAPQTRLRLTGQPGREVWLDGHAYFAVAKHDAARFRVRTQAGDAVVLGTRFDLQARGSDMRVLVVEGRVEVGSRGDTRALSANEVGRVRLDAAPVTERVDSTVVRRELEWVGDFLVFADTPLEDVAEEMSRHYGVPFAVLDSALARETVHVWFSGQALERAVEVVCRTVRAHCTVHPDGVTIAP